MSDKILNEYYRDYLKKISKENIEKYHEDRQKDKEVAQKENKKDK